MSTGGGQNFTVGDYTFNSPVVTNGAGSVMLYLGATLRTSGVGGNYDSGNYSGDIEIHVDY